VRRLFWALVLVFAIAPLGSVQAGTVSISQEIHIRGVVPEMRYIVLDSDGNIIEITSNTTNDVTPVVKQGSLTSDDEVPLTQAVYDDYLAKTEGKDLSSVDLHFAPAAQTFAANEKSSWLAALARISLLRF
jgi:hypothetical protein